MRKILTTLAVILFGSLPLYTGMAIWHLLPYPTVMQIASGLFILSLISMASACISATFEAAGLATLQIIVGFTVLLGALALVVLVASDSFGDMVWLSYACWASGLTTLAAVSLITMRGLTSAVAKTEAL